MSSCNFDVFRAAQSAIAQYGAMAHDRAQCHREDYPERGDLQRAEVWLRIVAAIEFLAERRVN